MVVADIEEAALEKAVAQLTEAGAEAIGVRTDVTSFESVAALADAAYDAFGAVHLLCNNAGVGPPGGLVWDSTPNDWKWTFAVNVFGVAHGIQAFVPRMIAGGEEGLVINTSSTDGPIAPMPQASVYAASKCAVTCLTECLGAQLEAEGTAAARRRSSTRPARACSTPASGPRTATAPPSWPGNGPGPRRR